MVRLIDKYFHLKEYVLNLFCPYVPAGQLGFGGFGGKRDQREGQDSTTFFKSLFFFFIIKVTIIAYLILVISFTQAGFSNSKFYTKKYLKFTPKRVKYVFVNLENFYTGSARGARDKYEVWT